MNCGNVTTKLSVRPSVVNFPFGEVLFAFFGGEILLKKCARVFQLLFFFFTLIATTHISNSTG